MERIAKETYEGKLKRGQLDQEHITKTFNELQTAAQETYGKNAWTKVNKSTNAPNPEVLKMKQNLYKFSGAKNYAMLQEINEILTKDSQMQNFNNFKNKVLQLNDRYNKNYLQAEWQTSRQAGRMANLWEEYEDNKELFPSLRYRTQGDDRVREEHEKLDGIIKPIDDKFWDSYYPPNGWRCRCYVVQTAERATPDQNMPEIQNKDVKPEFKTNVGKGGEIFKETEANKGQPHPYFALAKTANSETQKAFEYSKLAAASPVYHKSKNGGEVKVSPYTDTREDELIGNYRAAVALADNFNLKVELKAKLNADIVLKVKNPDFLINGKLADRKTPKGLNFKNILRSANRQKVEKVVIDLNQNSNSFDKVISSLQKKLNMADVYPEIKEVYVISKDRKRVEVIKR